MYLTSDGGVLLLRDIDQKLGLPKEFSKHILDPRNPTFIQHSTLEMVRQRVLKPNRFEKFEFSFFILLSFRHFEIVSLLNKTEPQYLPILARNSPPMSQSSLDSIRIEWAPFTALCLMTDRFPVLKSNTVVSGGHKNR